MSQVPISRAMAAILFLLSTTSLAQDLKKIDVDAPSATACAFENLTLPENLRVYAAGAPSGRRLGYALDESGHEATGFDITVNSASQPVALLLGAYEPAVWNISWSKGTRIVAVMISGYHHQAIAGLDESVPVLKSSYDNPGPCGYFYVSGTQTAAVNPIARKLFQRPVDQVFPGYSDAQILVGDSLSAGVELLTAAWSRQAAIDTAVAKGLLRPATPADLDAWVVLSTANSPKPGLNKAYVVLAPFTYPGGLVGDDSVTFFILRGGPRPSGNPGQSAVYDFNSLTCSGLRCARSSK